MNKGKKIWLVILEILAIILVVLFFTIKIIKSNNSKDKDTSQTQNENSVQTINDILPFTDNEEDNNAYETFVEDENGNNELSKKDREFWNDLLNRVGYMYNLDVVYPIQYFVDREKILYIALYSNEIETEEITENDIEENFILQNLNVQKKSKASIDKYLFKIFGVEEGTFDYSSAETFVEDEKCLLIGRNYVYFTELEPLEQKIYIATDCMENNNYISVKIHEYTVKDENSKKLKKMLNSGNIDNEIEQDCEYRIIGEKSDDSIVIKYKYKNREEIDELNSSKNEIKSSIQEFMNSVDRKNSPANAHSFDSSKSEIYDENMNIDEIMNNENINNENINNENFLNTEEKIIEPNSKKNR